MIKAVVAQLVGKGDVRMIAAVSDCLKDECQCFGGLGLARGARISARAYRTLSQLTGKGAAVAEVIVAFRRIVAPYD